LQFIFIQEGLVRAYLNDEFFKIDFECYVTDSRATITPFVVASMAVGTLQHSGHYSIIKTLSPIGALISTPLGDGGQDLLCNYLLLVWV
jgi:hypothetical protein